MNNVYLDKFAKDGYFKIKNAIDKNVIRELETEILSHLTGKKIKNLPKSLNSLSDKFDKVIIAKIKKKIKLLNKKQIKI